MASTGKFPLESLKYLIKCILTMRDVRDNGRLSHLYNISHTSLYLVIKIAIIFIF